MKNKIIVVLALFLLFASCEKNKEKKFTGKYIGTLEYNNYFIDNSTHEFTQLDHGTTNDFEDEVYSYSSELYFKYIDYYKINLKKIKQGKEYIVNYKTSNITGELKVTFFQNEVNYKEIYSRKSDSITIHHEGEFWGAKDY